MPHFYVLPQNAANGSFIMENELAHYVAAVRRFKVGDEINLFDGLGKSFKGKITNIEKNRIDGKILSSSYQKPAWTANLYTAIPKGERFEWLIEKCAELGLSKIVPINTARSVLTEISENKIERFKRISIAASSQCGRADIMEICRPLNFQDACKKAVSDKTINILPWESESGQSISQALSGKPLKSGIAAFIGPEGGFENAEIDFAKTLGFYTVSLGKNILRVETAALATAVLVTNTLSEQNL
ncbi:MAG: 16S rRNA (uracil(1498)-N(3))-methyltransferase [Endomicrobium sp.]|jgi:16S rRNA (uracil1498-N3)-methyltransferase|nr:16S rRNA (uracil(1498)-N(3))-methyltransferase [Endomicrobium sp.]